ncbi:MAG: alkylhydroperoxidase [Rhodospirillaceae bacterium]|nr:alkylhydroperoxidase [Rhodospirillaceae bacterium]
MFLQTVTEEDATGAIAEVYAKEKAGVGFVPEAARCFSTRPDMPPLFDVFFDGIKANFSLSGREWCLITFVAAKHLRSTYCSQVYSSRMLALGESKETLLAIQSGGRTAALSDKDLAMLAYAEKVTTAADRITQSDVDRLRAFGFTDRNIFDIALCASFRCMLSRMVDATGAVPEPAFYGDEAFRKAMTVGRKLRDQ